MRCAATSSSACARAEVRLPDDLVGDDGLLGAMAKTDLANEDDVGRRAAWFPALEAGFLCEPAELFSPATLVGQYRRMVNYSVRHFQNRMITAIMRGEGPKGLPPRLAALYPAWLPQLSPRAGIRNGGGSTARRSRAWRARRLLQAKSMC